MKIRMAYCSACDRNVRVVSKSELLDQMSDARPREGDSSVPDPSDLICLEFGSTCTGDMCPLFGVPTEEMRERYLRFLEDSPDAAD